MSEPTTATGAAMLADELNIGTDDDLRAAILAIEEQAAAAALQRAERAECQHHPNWNPDDPGYGHCEHCEAILHRDMDGTVVAELPRPDLLADKLRDAENVIVMASERAERAEAALYRCGLAAHFGGEAYDTKRRGAREKLAFIERTAAAALAGTPAPAETPDIDVERLAKAIEVEGKSGRWSKDGSREMRFINETMAALIAETYRALRTPDTDR